MLQYAASVLLQVLFLATSHSLHVKRSNTCFFIPISGGSSSRVIPTPSRLTSIVPSIKSRNGHGFSARTTSLHVLPPHTSPNFQRWCDTNNLMQAWYSIDTSEPADSAGEKEAHGKELKENSERLRSKAEKLAMQAEKLKLEAEMEQMQLDIIRLEKRKTKLSKVDALIPQVLNSSFVELRQVVIDNKAAVDLDLFFRLAELANAAKTLEERQRYTGAAEYLLLTLEAIDIKQAEEISSAILKDVSQAQSKLAEISLTSSREPSSAMDPNNVNGDMLRKWIEQTLKTNNQTINASTLGSVNFLPQWIPVPLVPFILRYDSTQMSQEDIEAMRKDVFTMDSFYVTSTEISPAVAIFRGNMRGDSGDVYKRVNQRLQALPGLSSRVQLFLLPDPVPDGVRRMELLRDGMDGPIPEPDPVFVAIPEGAQPFQQGLGSYSLTALAALGALFTTFSYALGTYAFSSEFLSKLTEGDTSVVTRTFPVVAGLMGVQVLHELGHAIAAQVHKVKLAPPVLIPSLQLGSFGAITRFLSFPSNRIAQFDVAYAGPLFGMISSLALLFVGLYTTAHPFSPADISNFPILPAGLFRSSLLVGIFAELLTPDVMASLATVPVPVSPLTLAAISGILLNALNLMPVGRLDGGRIATATFGRKNAATAGNLLLLAQALSFLFSTSSLQLFWGLVIVLFQRAQDVPAKDEVTPLDNTRTSLFYVAMAASALALLPFPGGGAFF